MKDYFICLFAASLISGVICLASEGSGFEKSIRYVCAVIGIVLVISPFAKIRPGEIKSFELPPSPTVGSTDIIKEVAEENAKEYISSLCYKKFGITCTGVCIDLYSEANEMTVNGITVYISGGDREEVSNYLEGLLGGNIEVRS